MAKKNKNSLEYIINGKTYPNDKGALIDSLSNVLRRLQGDQTLNFQKNNPSIPVNNILLNSSNDKTFRNSKLNQRADSLSKIYGDKSIPMSKEFLNTNIEYNNLLNESGYKPNLIGDKEVELSKFGYRSMMQKYPHSKEIPAYKILENNDNMKTQYSNGGTIKIDPSKKGTFTAQATRMGMGIQEAASKILSAPEGKYSPAMRKKANFATQAVKWKHDNGGFVKGSEYDLTNDEMQYLKSIGYEFE